MSTIKCHTYVLVKWRPYIPYLKGGNLQVSDKIIYAVMAAHTASAMGPFESVAEATGRNISVILERNKKWKGPGQNSVVMGAANQYWIIYHTIDAGRTTFERVMLIDKISFENGGLVDEKGTPSTIAQKLL